MKINDKEIDTQQYRNDWALALMSQGIVVKLTLIRWRATASLSPEELGLKFNDENSRKFNENYIHLGKEKLLPPEVDKKISQVELKARQNLRTYSFPTVWGWFVPFTAFDLWEEENEKIRKEYFEIANELGEQYYSIIDTVKNDYTHMANDVWARLYPDKGNPAPSFITNFVNKIADKIPPRANIVSSFKYDTTYFVIPMPSIIEDNLSKARQEQRQREMDDFKSKLEKNTRKKVADEYLKRKQELIDGFLESTVNNIRSHVADLCNGVLEALSKQSSKREITRSQRDKLKKTIEKVRLLNFYDDKEMANLLTNLETEMDKFKGERDHNEIVLTLQKIVEVGTEEFIPSDFNPSISTLEV
jgi:hypothetical protein